MVKNSDNLSCLLVWELCFLSNKCSHDTLLLTSFRTHQLSQGHEVCVRVQCERYRDITVSVLHQHRKQNYKSTGLKLCTCFGTHILIHLHSILVRFMILPKRKKETKKTIFYSFHRLSHLKAIKKLHLLPVINQLD